MISYQRSTCRGCGRPIIWVQVKCSKCKGAARACTNCRERGVVRVPLDATAPVFEVGLEPDPSPERGDQPPFAVNVGGPGRRHFTSHFVTCPKREEFSRKASDAKEGADG